jgi:tetratricopeptide (TPR) repeat protein
MPSLKQAQLRHIAFYEEILWQANTLYLKGSASTNESLVLFDQNWENIQLGHSYAALLAEIDRTAAQFCSKYASSGAFILNLRQPPPERITWLENALYHARRLGNRQAEGWHLGNLGSAYRDIGENEKAIQWFERGLQLFRELKDVRAESSLHSNLGNIYSDTGKYEKAIDSYSKALQLDETSP